MSQLFYCFEPIIDSNTKILILGTSPGVRSHENKEYYNHEDNIFWDFIFRIFHEEWGKFQSVDDKVTYEMKRNILLKNNIGLWDVLKYCERVGSSDNKITKYEINDFGDLLKNYPNIKKIIFNGNQAAKYLNDVTIPESINVKVLLSTSPGNRANPFWNLEQWSKELTSI